MVWNETVFVWSTEMLEIELFFDNETVLTLNSIVWNRSFDIYLGVKKEAILIPNCFF